jgi:hypothetical protein
MTAFLVIELVNAWSGYCRYFYLSCAYGAKDGSRARACATPLFASEADALTHVITTLNPDMVGEGPPWAPGDEPAWHQPPEFVSALQTLRARNLPTVVSAVSASTPAFELLPTFRNFYAHRGEVTARKAKRLGTRLVLPTTLHPTEMLNSLDPSSGKAFLRTWMEDIRGVLALTV